MAFTWLPVRLSVHVFRYTIVTRLRETPTTTEQKGSKYNEDSLVEKLNDVYSYIIESPSVEWDVLMSKCYEVAKDVLAEQKPQKVTNEYYKTILDDIRKTRISLTEAQIQEAKSAYGEKYRNAFMGRILLTKDGINLDSQWQEWSQKYPEIFDAEVSGGDQIIALSEIYDSLREGAEMYERLNDEESIRA